MPSVIPCDLSPLISRIHSFFLDWWRTVSSKFFDTQVPSISTKEIILPRHARCVLSRLRCNGHSFLLSSYLSRIGRILPVAPADTRRRTSLISLCTVQLRPLWRLSISAISGPGPGELPGFWGSNVFHHAPIPRKVSGNNNNLYSY